MKKTIQLLLIILAMAIAPLGMLCVFYYSLPNQYQETYLGELESYYDKLTKTNDKKIVVIGGSNVAFGLDVSGMEQATGYKVVPMGLYATLGTKLMLDLSLANVNEGDIVIVAPETANQSHSLYFNPESTLQAIGGKEHILRHLDLNCRKQMLYKATKYIGDNFSLLVGKNNITLSNVYQKSSFDDNCNMIYDRPKNIMSLGYDPTMEIDFDAFVFNGEFFDYLNEYSKKIMKRKASIYYDFSPMNELAVTHHSNESVGTFYDKLQQCLDFEIIGNPFDYIMDSKYFYDSNFHLNNVGSAIRTKQLIEDIYRVTGNSDQFDYITSDIYDDESSDSEEESGEEGEDIIHVFRNQEHEQYFLYETFGSGIAITGVKAEYKSETLLRIPSIINNINVVALNKDAFADCNSLTNIHIYRPLGAIISGAFNGCNKLEKIYIHAEANDILVSNDGSLLSGCSEKTKIMVYSDFYFNFNTNYFWGRYSSRIDTFV